MMEAPIENIEKHSYILNEVFSSTKKIHHYAVALDMDNLYFESDNRDRMMNILHEIQEGIEGQVDNLPEHMITKDIVEILRSWQLQVNKLIETIEVMNKEIIEVLEASKDETTKEIALLFKSKENFRGYNLNNVKK